MAVSSPASPTASRPIVSGYAHTYKAPQWVSLTHFPSVRKRQSQNLNLTMNEEQSRLKEWSTFVTRTSTQRICLELVPALAWYLGSLGDYLQDGHWMLKLAPSPIEQILVLLIWAQG